MFCLFIFIFSSFQGVAVPLQRRLGWERLPQKPPLLAACQGPPLWEPQPQELVWPQKRKVTFLCVHRTMLPWNTVTTLRSHLSQSLASGRTIEFLSSAVVLRTQFPSSVPASVLWPFNADIVYPTLIKRTVLP